MKLSYFLSLIVTTTSFTGPEPVCEELKRAQGEFLRGLETEWWKSYWNTIPGLRQTYEAH